MRWNDEIRPGPVPLWSQIAERLKASIASGDFKPGDALPSETEINAAFKVSRTTARASLDHLRNEGLIIRKSGRGSIVLRPRVDRPANQLSSFAEDMRRRGLRPSYATFSAADADLHADAADALGLPHGGAAFRIHRLLLADDEPMGMSESWLSPSILGGRAPTPDELDAGSLYDWLATHRQVRIAGAQEFVEAAVADAAMARRLEVPLGSALLVARRRSHSEEGSPIEFAVMHYRADRYRFSIERGGP